MFVFFTFFFYFYRKLKALLDSVGIYWYKVFECTAYMPYNSTKNIKNKVCKFTHT